MSRRRAMPEPARLLDPEDPEREDDQGDPGPPPEFWQATDEDLAQFDTPETFWASEDDAGDLRDEPSRDVADEPVRRAERTPLRIWWIRD